MKHCAVFDLSRGILTETETLLCVCVPAVCFLRLCIIIKRRESMTARRSEIISVTLTCCACYFSLYLLHMREILDRSTRTSTYF